MRYGSAHALSLGRIRLAQSPGGNRRVPGRSQNQVRRNLNNSLPVVPFENPFPWDLSHLLVA